MLISHGNPGTLSQALTSSKQAPAGNESFRLVDVKLHLMSLTSSSNPGLMFLEVDLFAAQTNLIFLNAKYYFFH